MAIIKCPECKNSISNQATACPHCGYTKSKPKSNANNIGCGTIILGIIVFAIFSNLYDKSSRFDNPPPPKTAEEVRTDQIARAFSAWNGSHIQLTRYVKERLKDPGSFEHIQTRYGDNGDTLYVTMRYRAKNSFGGYVVNTATATAKIDGTLIEANIGESR